MSQPDRSLLFVTNSDLSGTSGHNVATSQFVTGFGRVFDGDLVVVCPQPHFEYTEKVSRNVDAFYHFTQANTKTTVDHFTSSIKLLVQTQKAIAESDPAVLIGRMAPLFWAPPLLARKHQIPYALLSRGTAYKRLNFSTILTQIYKLNVQMAEHVYVASEEIRRDTKAIQKSGQDPPILLPNGVDPELFQATSKQEARSKINADLSRTDFVIGFVGSMNPRHCVEELFAALEELPAHINPKLLLVGDGPKMDDYRDSARKFSVAKRTIFTGAVSHEEVPRYISACDVAYGVTTQVSATPLKCFEYLACERPVIVRDIPELAFVKMRNLGRSVNRISPDKIADAIRYLYELQNNERQEMGKRGREHVLNRYSWDRIVKAVLDDFIDTYNYC